MASLAPATFSSAFQPRVATSTHDQLTEQARKWVAGTFYGTLLKQMRDGPFHSKLLDGGHGGQTFATMLDQRLADHMARASGSKLVNSIVRRIEASAAYRKGAAKMPAKPAPATAPKDDQPRSQKR